MSNWRGIFLRAGISIVDNTFTFAANKDVVYRLSSSLTAGTVRGVTNTVTMTATGLTIVEALRSAISSEVRTGAWANALVGSINYGTTGSANGMAAAIAAEMIPPNGSLSRGALYALDVVFGCGASATWASAGPVGFMRFENWGTKTHFSANAFFFHLVGETAATGGLLSLNSRTLRVRIGTTTKYLYLSDTEDDLGAMAVDSITIAANGTDGIVISGDMTDNGIQISGSCTGSAIEIDTGTNGIGLNVNADGTTAINVSSNFTGTTMLALGGTGTTGIAITGACTTALNISGATTTDVQLSEGTTIIDAAANGGSCTITQDGVMLVAGGWGKIHFGGFTDWGAGATGTLIDGTGYDWVTGTVGYATSGALATACAAAYHAFTVNQTTHTTASSFFGTWTELYLIADCILTGSANTAAVWGQVEGLGAFTTPDSGDFVTAGYFNMISGGAVTLTAGSSLNGLRVKGEVSSVSGTGRFAAIEILAVTTDWTEGIYIGNTTTGINVAAATTGIQVSGATTTGLYISGLATTGIRVAGILNATVTNLKSVYLETTIGGSGEVTGYVTGLHIETYINSAATVPAHYGALIQTDSEIAGSKNVNVIRLEHNGASVADSFINVQAQTTKMEYLLDSSHTAELWCNNTATTPTGAGGWLRVKLGGTVRYINLYTTP